MTEQKNNKPVLESIDGVVVKVERGNEPVVEKEWLLAKVNNISRQKSNIEGWNDSFHWEFLIYDERAKNRKVWANSSLYVTQGTRTYNWITSIMGVNEIAVGSDIKMSDLIGKFCYIMMVASTKKKGKQVVGEIKFCDKKASEISDDVEEIKETTTKKENKKKVVEEQPQDDEEEINIDDINLDDI